MTSSTPLQIPDGYRSGYVALIGKPNVGKSTLLNALMGRKLSIVTHKPQTTRHRVLGILSDEERQIIFLDTPGIIRPRYKLQESMMHAVRGAVRDADVTIFMADATQGVPDTLSLEQIENKEAILAINKMDLIEQEQAIPLVSAYAETRAFEEIIPISALEGDNLDLLMQEIDKRLPEGPPFYPPDMISEHPERFFVAEMVREKILQQYQEEIPYSVQVNVISHKARPDSDDKDLIHADIVVSRKSQKGILIGKGGRALKGVGTAARKDIEAFLGRPVFLKLHVKVRENWRDRSSFLRSYGYRT